MELLDGLAMTVGQSACRFLSRNDHQSFGQFLCSDGDYSAGWKLIVASMVLVGFVLAWLAMTAGQGRKL